MRSLKYANVVDYKLDAYANGKRSMSESGADTVEKYIAIFSKIAWTKNIIENIKLEIEAYHVNLREAQRTKLIQFKELLLKQGVELAAVKATIALAAKCCSKH